MKDGHGVTAGLLVRKTGMEDALWGQMHMIQKMRKDTISKGNLRELFLLFNVVSVTDWVLN